MESVESIETITLYFLSAAAQVWAAILAFGGIALISRSRAYLEEEIRIYGLMYDTFLEYESSWIDVNSVTPKELEELHTRMKKLADFFKSLTEEQFPGNPILIMKLKAEKSHAKYFSKIQKKREYVDKFISPFFRIAAILTFVPLASFIFVPANIENWWDKCCFSVCALFLGYIIASVFGLIYLWKAFRDDSDIE